MSAAVQALLKGARQASDAGRWADCERISKSALAEDPDNIDALVLLGSAISLQGRYEDAISLFQRAVQISPNSTGPYRSIIQAHLKVGRTQAALQPAIALVELSPSDPVALYYLAKVHLDLGEFSAAEPYFKRASELAPTSPQIFHGHALVLRRLGRNQEALAAISVVLRLDPKSLPGLITLRELLSDEPDVAAFVHAASAVVSLQPNSAEAHLWLARAFLEAKRTLDAEPHVLRAIELGPDTGVAYSLLGWALQIKGDIDQAHLNYRKSIEMLPNHGAAYLGWARTATVSEADRPIVNQMLGLVADSALSAHALASVHFALGKSFEDLQDYESAMAHFEEGNRIQFERKSQRPSLLSDLIERGNQMGPIVKGNPSFEARTNHHKPGTMPIFVVGMIRSGTTLVDRILSSHPDVGTAGELGFWLARLAETDDPSEIPEKSGTWATDYEALLHAAALGKSFVVDKNPLNYLALALIRFTFPDAKIIHVRRDPVDTAVSIFTTPNSSPLPFMHQKDSIVSVYRHYEKLMDQWRTVLPPDAMIEVSYEDLVGSQEATTRALLAACELPWSDSCLRPEDNKTSVFTPSMMQVRRPVYKTSVNRSHRFAPWLGPLAQLAK